MANHWHPQFLPAIARRPAASQEGSEASRRTRKAGHRRVVDALPEPTKSIVTLTVVGSLRIGEVTALRWGRIHPDRIETYVLAEGQRVYKKVYIGFGTLRRRHKLPPNGRGSHAHGFHSFFPPRLVVDILSHIDSRVSHIYEGKNSKCFIWCRLGSSVPLFLSLSCTEVVPRNPVSKR